MTRSQAAWRRALRSSRLVLCVAVAWSPLALAGSKDPQRARELLQAGQPEAAIEYISAALTRKQDVEDIVALRALLDEALFAKAEAGATAASYSAYLAARPQGAQAPVARSRVCELAFSEASAAGDAGLLAFAEAHAACPQAQAARGAAAEVAYESALRDGTSDALRRALDQHPAGARASEVREAEEAAHYRELLAAPSAAAAAAYLAEHPAGPHAPEARVIADPRAAAASGASERGPVSVAHACSSLLTAQRVALVDGAGGRSAPDALRQLRDCTSGPSAGEVEAAMEVLGVSGRDLLDAATAEVVASFLDVGMLGVVEHANNTDSVVLHLYTERATGEGEIVTWKLSRVEGPAGARVETGAPASRPLRLAVFGKNLDLGLPAATLAGSLGCPEKGGSWECDVETSGVPFHASIAPHADGSLRTLGFELWLGIDDPRVSAAMRHTEEFERAVRAAVAGWDSVGGPVVIEAGDDESPSDIMGGTTRMQTWSEGDRRLLFETNESGGEYVSWNASLTVTWAREGP